MVQPINYMTNVRTPFEMAMMGRNQALQQNIQQQALDAARAQEEARQKMRADFAKFAETKGKTLADYQYMMEKYPDLYINIDRSFQNLTNEQKQNRLDMALSVRGALKRNKPEEAMQILQQQADAARNSGYEDQAVKAEAMIKSIEASPEGSFESINMTIARTDPKLFQLLMEKEQGTKASKRPVRSETLPDGTTIIVGATGDVTVKDASNKILTGKEAIKAVKAAQEYGINIAEMKKAATSEAGAAVEAGVKYAERLDKISEQIGTIDEAINIVSEGIENKKDLGVGPIRRFFPAFSKSANELKNVGSRLGLGVVQSATFGALSEGELKMALDTAMPRNLSGKNLLGWLEKRKTAQEKLAGYLQEAATFIGSPKEDGTGINTVRDWVRMQKEGVQSETMPASQQEQYQTVTTQEQYNALPSGAIFIEDGKKYRKP